MRWWARPASSVGPRPGGTSAGAPRSTPTAPGPASGTAPSTASTTEPTSRQPPQPGPGGADGNGDAAEAPHRPLDGGDGPRRPVGRRRGHVLAVVGPGARRAGARARRQRDAADHSGAGGVPRPLRGGDLYAAHGVGGPPGRPLPTERGLAPRRGRPRPRRRGLQR